MSTFIGELDGKLLGPDTPESRRSTRELTTGSWRTWRPAFVQRPSPCNLDCPAGTDVRQVLSLAADGDVEGAWRLIREHNPLPGVCGRVCYHPCELACNRMRVDEPIGVHLVERALADQARARHYGPESAALARPPRLVAVIGAGPAGLSCAYQLARRGNHVTVFDACARPGGLLRYGIPAYRLPRDVLDAEIALLHQLGVRFVGRARWNRDMMNLESFDATFLAVGLQHSREAGIPGERLQGVRTGLDFLRDVNLTGGQQMTGPVVVIGGGNTALDAARCALRLGGCPQIVYRRGREDMPAHPDEIAEAEAEGIPFMFHAAPVRFLRQGGHVSEVECQRMRPGPPDASGRRRPEPIPGATFRLPARLVLTAVGEELEREVVADLADATSGRILADRWGRTSHRGFFAGGDAATGAGTVVDAIGSGQRAAIAMLALFDGNDPQESGLVRRVGGDDLNLFYFETAAAARPPHRSQAEARGTFEEVVAGLAWDEARREARRCVSCGLCTGCGTCVTYCPDVAIRPSGTTGYEIDYAHCKGCGLCAQECPRGALTLTTEAGR
ncbi:MAG: FAD-dependent oxidoreductase [Vicinamibacterales bacterium]